MSKRWYVVHAYSGFDKQVKAILEERVRLHELQDFFGDILVPTEEVIENRSGKQRRSERKFFPGYVFVEMEMNDETWHMVNQTPRVLGFIGGTPERPAPIPRHEAEAILRRIDDSSEAPRPKTLFEPGETVRIIDGPFADFDGVVEEIDYEKSKLKIAVLILGRSTAVELDFGQVEKTS